MNASELTKLERIYFQGKRQRKYVGKISEVAQELADMIIQSAVSCELSQGVYWISFTQDDNLVDCEIRQSDYILSISMISFGATPDMWPRNYYKLGKTITEYIVNAVAAKQTTPAPEPAQDSAIEAPATDSAIEEIPCVLEDKNTRIAELEAQLNAMTVDRDDWKQSCISANRRFEANDAATKEVFELRKQVEKLQADNAAYEAIVLQAGQDFKVLNNQLETMKRLHLLSAESKGKLNAENEVLKAENARYRVGLKRLVATMDEKLEKTCNWGDYNNARNQANDILVVVDFAAVETPITPQAPKETQILPSDAIGDCEVCGGDGWLLEPVSGYHARKIRCKYCDGTGNEYGMTSGDIEDNIS